MLRVRGAVITDKGLLHTICNGPFFLSGVLLAEPMDLGGLRKRDGNLPRLRGQAHSAIGFFTCQWQVTLQFQGTATRRSGEEWRPHNAEASASVCKRVNRNISPFHIRRGLPREARVLPHQCGCRQCSFSGYA